jgi:hypothetical protein
VSAPRRSARLRTIEAWLWTGPVGHLLGGALDVLEALARYAIRRLLRRLRTPRAAAAREL